MVVVCECKTIWKGPYLAKSLFFGEPYLLIPLRIRGNRLAATYFLHFYLHMSKIIRTFAPQF